MKSKKILTKLLLLISISFITLIAVFGIKNKNKLIKSTVSNIIKTGIDISIDNIYLIEEEEGKTKWELNADKAEVLLSKKITRLKNIRMNLFQNNNQISVSADIGTIHNESDNAEKGKNTQISSIELNRNIQVSNVVLEGNIQVSSGEGHVLTTDNLIWVSEKKTFETADDVKITSDNLILTGKGMKVNIDTEVLEIYGGVKALFSDIKTIM
jgi:lipopolysaccharide export system protein LptC